jgi:hypothetical protein
MIDEKEEIRGALLAMMCVGDNIKYIYPCHGGYYRIYKVRIMEVINTTIVVSDWGVCSKDSIDCYEGELYIWETRYAYSDARTKKMVTIINSKYTHNDC